MDNKESKLVSAGKKPTISISSEEDLYKLQEVTMLLNCTRKLALFGMKNTESILWSEVLCIFLKRSRDFQSEM